MATVDTGAYPYKYDEAIAAGIAVEDADVFRDYIEAQHAVLNDQTPANIASFNALNDAVAKISIKNGSKGGTSVTVTNGSAN